MSEPQISTRRNGRITAAKGHSLRLAPSYARFAIAVLEQAILDAELLGRRMRLTGDQYRHSTEQAFATEIARLHEWLTADRPYSLPWLCEAIQATTGSEISEAYIRASILSKLAGGPRRERSCPIVRRSGDYRNMGRPKDD